MIFSLNYAELSGKYADFEYSHIVILSFEQRSVAVQPCRSRSLTDYGVACLRCGFFFSLGAVPICLELLLNARSAE